MYKNFKKKKKSKDTLKTIWRFCACEQSQNGPLRLSASLEYFSRKKKKKKSQIQLGKSETFPMLYSVVCIWIAIISRGKEAERIDRLIQENDYESYLLCFRPSKRVLNRYYLFITFCVQFFFRCRFLLVLK